MLDLTLDLSRLVTEVRRVADAAESLVDLCRRLIPPIPNPPEIRQSTLDDLHTIDDKEQEQIKQNRRDLAARFGCMPESTAFNAALAEYEAEMLRLRPQDPPIDWRAAFGIATNKEKENGQ